MKILDNDFWRRDSYGYETCIGIDSEKYRGHYVRCSNIPADKSKYCEEHKSQGKWGLKKDLEEDDENNFILIFLFFLVTGCVLVLYFTDKFSDDFSSEATTLELIFIELCCCLPILFVLLSPRKAELTKISVDRIEEEKARENQQRSYSWELSYDERTYSQRPRKKYEDGDEADDVGDWGSGLGDGKGPSDEEDDDDDG